MALGVHNQKVVVLIVGRRIFADELDGVHVDCDLTLTHAQEAADIQQHSIDVTLTGQHDVVDLADVFPVFLGAVGRGFGVFGFARIDAGTDEVGCTEAVFNLRIKEGRVVLGSYWHCKCSGCSGSKKKGFHCKLLLLLSVRLDLHRVNQGEGREFRVWIKDFRRFLRARRARGSRLMRPVGVHRAQ